MLLFANQRPLCGLLLLLIGLLPHASLCFMMGFPVFTWRFSGSHDSKEFSPTFRLHMSSSDAGDDGLDAMRRMLEASWDVGAMGEVPRDPSAAAEAAVAALNQAIADNANSVIQNNAYLIDLQFPPYDLTQGQRLYDEVAVVEFGMELAQRLSQEKSCLILVRDETTVNTVHRVLEARADLQGDDVNVKRQDPAPDSQASGGALDGNTRNDDADHHKDADNNEMDETSAAASPDDVDSFRQQLMSSWDTLPAAEEAIPENGSSPQESQTETTTNNKPNYRLSSLFGSAKISQGADMVGDVFQSVKANARPLDEEETVIIFSAHQRDELVAIRAIVQQVTKDALEKGRNRNVVLVNCRIDPLPRELAQAKTVYSILPLLAKPASTSGGPFSPQQQPTEEEPPKPIKAVVLRRYPRDWEVFVDDGSSGVFELASTSPARLNEKRGPPVQWISNTIQMFLESRNHPRQQKF